MRCAMPSDDGESLPQQWDRMLDLYRESLGTFNGGYLSPMLDLVTELRSAPPACLLIPSQSLMRLVVSPLPPDGLPIAPRNGNPPPGKGPAVPGTSPLYLQ